MKKLLAVSGGVDSAVLLHIFRDDPEVVVAHFNHGTRPSADDDQLFVKKLAQKYHKPFYAATARLGEGVSEASARVARYNFLRRLAQEQQAAIYTAHHADDLVETIMINLLRGTGWRGLAALGAEDVRRPFLQTKLLPESARADLSGNTASVPNIFKTTLLQYATRHNLTFRADPTNSEEYYLRNRLRMKLIGAPVEFKMQLLQLYGQQLTIKAEVDGILSKLLPSDHIYQRAWFAPAVLPPAVALEYLRAALLASHTSATRPQLTEFLLAIQSYAPGKTFNLPGGKLVKLHQKFFVLN